MLFTSDLIIASGVSWNMTLREGECTNSIMVVEAIDQSWLEMAEATVPAVTQRGKRRESKASTVKPDWSAEPDPVSRLKQLLCFWVADNMVHINNLHLPCSKAAKAMCLSTPIKKQAWERTLVLKEDLPVGCGYSDHLTARRFWVWIPWGPGYVLCRGCMFSPCLWVLFGYSPKTCILGLGELVSRCPHSIMCGHIQTHSPQCSTYECVKQGLIWLKGLGGAFKVKHFLTHSSACAQNNETGSSKKLWSLCGGYAHICGSGSFRWRWENKIFLSLDAHLYTA